MAKFLIGLVTGVILVLLSMLSALLRLVPLPRKTTCDRGQLRAGAAPGRRHSRERRRWNCPRFSGDTAPQSPSPASGSTCAKPPPIRTSKRSCSSPKGLSSGWAKLEEIRSDLEQFRKSGKPVFAYLRTPGDARILRALPRPTGSLWAPADQLYRERPARRDDVLQEDAGQARRQRGRRARRQVQGLRRHVHAHRHEPGDHAR